VTLNGVPSGTNIVHVNDQSSPANAARLYTVSGIGLNGFQLTRSDPSANVGLMSLSGVSSFQLNASGNVNVLSSPIGTPSVINTGNSSDTITVGNTLNTLDNLQGALTINGQNGSDTLIINDQGSTTAHVYTQTATTVSRDGAATITFSSIESLQLHKSQVVGNPPMVTDLTFPSSIQAGHFATLSGRLIDPDAGDTLSLIVDWGDGSKPTQITPDREPFSLKHRYKHAGTYTVRAIWTDSTGQSNSRDLTLTVTPKGGGHASYQGPSDQDAPPVSRLDACFQLLGESQGLPGAPGSKAMDAAFAAVDILGQLGLKELAGHLATVQ
jgi:hypothetical protein